MSRKSQKSLDYFDYICEKLARLYDQTEINKQKLYVGENGFYFFLSVFPEEFNAIVIEYASNQEEAKNNIFEDGDLFYVDDFSKEEMLQAMIKEIEDE